MDSRSRSHGLQSSSGSRPSSSRGADISASVRSPAKPPSGPYVSDAFGSNPSTPALNVASQPTHGKPLPSLTSFPSSQSISVTVAPPGGEYPQQPKALPRFDISVEHDKPNPVKQSTLPIPHGSVEVDPDGRRRSYDDGVRPLNVLFGWKGDPTQQSEVPITAPAASEGLTVSTSRRDKRRSINPALSLSDFNLLSASSISPISPHLTSFQHQSDHPIPTPPTPGGRESPHVFSPLRDHFHTQSPPPSRPTSHSSTHLSHSSTQSPRVSASLSDYQTPDISRSPSPAGYTDEQSQDQTIVINQSSLSPVRLESVPPAKQRGKNGLDGQPLSTNGTPKNPDQPAASLGPKEADVLRGAKSFDDRQRPDSRPSSGNLGRHSLARSRSISPAYRADVPQNIESETDTEAEGDNNGQRAKARDSLPPAPPPKEEKDMLARSKSASASSDVDPDVSVMSNPDSGSDDMSESSPVERVQHSTFIAPALPPIRFSMDGAGFSGLFNMGGAPSLKSLDHLAKLTEDEFPISTTPPPTAALEKNLTPTSNITIIPTETSHDDESKAYDLDSLIDDDDQSIRYVSQLIIDAFCAQIFSFYVSADPMPQSCHMHHIKKLPRNRQIQITKRFCKPMGPWVPYMKQLILPALH